MNNNMSNNNCKHDKITIYSATGRTCGACGEPCALPMAEHPELDGWVDWYDYHEDDDPPPSSI